MEKATIIGIDLAKRVFQVHVAAKDGRPVLRKRVSRAQLLGLLAKQPPGRRLLIIGAMTVVRWAVRKGAATGSWLARMLVHKPRLVVAIALANKMASCIDGGIHPITSRRGTRAELQYSLSQQAGLMQNRFAFGQFRRFRTAERRAHTACFHAK